MSHRDSFSKTRKESVKLGRYVTPEPSSDSSSIQNVFGFIQDYIPQSYSSAGTMKAEKEKIVWARFETTDCNDVSMDHLNNEHTDESMFPMVLLLGLTNSFSVWFISPGGDAREVYTHQNGPIKLATLLQTPLDTVKDTFKDHRPLLAVVKKSNNSRSLFSSLVFLSLSGSDTNGREIKRLEFEKNTIIDIKLNRRFVVVVLQKRLVVFDAGSLEQKHTIKTGYVSSDLWVNPVALGVRWLALSDTKLHSYLQSVGGVSEQLTPPVASTVMNTVKKSFAAISDTISGLTGRGLLNLQTKLSSTEDTVSSSPTIQPVVTILDLLYPYTTEEVRVNELRRSEGVVAHFLTHLSVDVFITSMAFNKSGELLLIADSEGQFFNIFRILPYSTDYTHIQHLYSLYRGSTTGRVQDICFSNDSRWVGVSTLNGTTHIFPISTYGGLCSVRTHTSLQVVNQLSRFHTSADISSVHHPSGSQPNSSLPSSSQPPLQSAPSINTVPLVITPSQQIKQSYSTGTSVVSHSSLISSNPSGEQEKTSFTTCIRAIFTSVSNRSDYSDHSTVQYSLYVMNGLGEVVQYLLEPQPSHAAISDGEDGAIELACIPKLRWRLPSKLTEESIPLPFDEDNPLIKAYNDFKRFTRHSDGESCGGLHEEEWLSEVELLTYAPPTRRLWMGPQFTFKTLSDEKLDEERKNVTSSPTAILQPTNDVSELMDLSHLGLNSLLSSPPCYTTSRDKEDMASNPDTEGVDTGVEVFGSWKDVAPKLKTVKSDANLEQQILDAMKDGLLSHSPSTDGKPLITGFSPNKTQIGFHPSM